MITTTTPEQVTPQQQRLLTIGTVCARLKPEFPDISISKLRYLEDQGLVTPRRTQGGYRLFSDEDVDRLRRILQLQRDEFLPLRVIREELASSGLAERKRRRANLLEEEEHVDLAELCERAGISTELARELEGFGLLAPRADGGAKRYGEADVAIASACAGLSRFGIAPRHLRAFRAAADREAALLEAVVAPGLRSSKPERRQHAREELQTLAELAQELSQMLLWRELRRQGGLA